jgi:hypothetical protein
MEAVVDELEEHPQAVVDEVAVPNVDELLGRKADCLKTTAAFLSADTLCPKDGTILHDSLDENSHKHAFAVSGDLKYGLRKAVELLANEYVWYQRNVAKQPFSATTTWPASSRSRR